MKAIIVSDLHIGSVHFKFREFEHFLEKIPSDCEFVLNGDVIDNPHRKLRSPEQKILRRLAQISLGQRVVWVQGNHDNGYSLREFGKVIFKQIHSVGDRLLVAHGDNFDQIMPKNQSFMKAFHWMHQIRVILGARPVHVAEYAKKWPSFYNVFRKNVMMNAVKCAVENGYDAVTCGHTHFPEDTVLDGIRYMNTGAWTESPPRYLLATSNEAILKTWDGSFEGV